MRFRRPSAGLLYLLLTATGAVAFFDYLTQPFFFEHPTRSAENNLGEARYLLKLARQSTGDTANRFLATARQLAEVHKDQALIREIAKQQERRALSQDLTTFAEVQSGISLAGFDKSGKTKGSAMGAVRLHNPTAAALRILLKFETDGDALGQYVIAGNANTFAFVGDQLPKHGSFLTPVIGARQTLDLQVGIHAAGPYDLQLPGLQFAGAEIRQ